MHIFKLHFNFYPITFNSFILTSVNFSSVNPGGEKIILTITLIGKIIILILSSQVNSRSQKEIWQNVKKYRQCILTPKQRYCNRKSDLRISLKDEMYIKMAKLILSTAPYVNIVETKVWTLYLSPFSGIKSSRL